MYYCVPDNCVKNLMYVISCNHNSALGTILIPFLLLLQTWGLEMLTDLTKSTQLEA